MMLLNEKDGTMMKNPLSWEEWFETHMNTEMQPEEAVMSKESLDLLSVPISFQKSAEKVAGLGEVYEIVQGKVRNFVRGRFASVQESRVEEGSLVSACPYCGAGCYVAPADDPDLCDEVHVTCDHCVGVFRAST